MMYLEFFGLQAKPFHTTPDPYFLYLSPSHKQALGSIIYGVKEKKGFIAVTGEVGLGKTTILRSFLVQIDQVNLQTIYLFNPNLSFASVLKKLLCELGHDPIEGGDAEVVDQLHTVLIDEYYKSKTVVLLIDDAQNMPVATLEQLRMLSNLETSKDKLLQIVLLGQPELDSLLDRFELRQIRQRIALRATIHPLSQKESFQYIRHRLDKAGGEGKAIFANDALKRIVCEAKGIPRRLNIICDNALVTAFGYQKNPVTVHIAKEVLNDLAGKSSYTFWKLIPLAAGALVLLLALVTLMSVADSKFPQTHPLQKLGQLFDQGVEQSRKLLVASTATNVSTKEYALLSEAGTSVQEDVEPLVTNPTESLRMQPKVGALNEPSLQLAEKVSKNLEELPPSEIIPQVISVKEVVPAMDAGALKQPTVGNAQDVVEKSKKLTNIEIAPFDKPIKKNAPLMDHEVLKQPAVNKVQDVVEISEESSTLEIFPTVEPVNIVATSINSEVLSQPTKKNVKVVVGKSEARSKLESISKDRSDKDGEPSRELLSKKRSGSVLPLPVTKTLKKGDTLAGFMLEIYGSVSSTTLQLVLNHNPHIGNVRKIHPGQQILFPPLTNSEAKNPPVEDGRALLSHTGKELQPSKKIFTESLPRIRTNQKKVEAKRTKPYAVGIVQEGDTLEKLAKLVYGSSDPLYVQRIMEFNPKIQNAKKIFPGQDIVFPRVEEVKDRGRHANQVFSRE